MLLCPGASHHRQLCRIGTRRTRRTTIRPSRRIRADDCRWSPNQRMYHATTTTTTTHRTTTGNQRIPTSTNNKHMHSYHLTGTGGPGPLLQASAAAVAVHEDTRPLLRTDLPRRMGGTDTAPQPVELLLGALMGCTQATVLFVARHCIRPQEKNNAQQQQQRRILQIHHCSYDIRAERDPQGALALPFPTTPSRLQRVSGTVTLHLLHTLVAPKVLEELQQQTELRCPIANMMLASGCHMDIEWRQVVYDKKRDE